MKSEVLTRSSFGLATGTYYQVYIQPFLDLDPGGPNIVLITRLIRQETLIPYEL